MNVTINYLAVFVSAIIFMVIGFLWYSPILFAKSWMKLVKKTEKDIKDGAKPYLYFAAFIMALLANYVLASVIGYYQATTALSGVMVGFWMWLGFTGATSATSYIFEGRPRDLFVINYGYFLVSMIITGAILAVWR